LSGRAIHELISLEGRNAVVTGGARGIGFAIAERLAEAGAGVLIGDLNVHGAGIAAESLFGDRVIAGAVEVADRRSVSALADRAEAELGGIDIWVNNAGIYPADPPLDIDDEQWNRVLAVNLHGTYLGAREAANRMIRQGKGGIIINISTAPAYVRDGEPHYVASKLGVVALTRRMAAELGEAGIRILALAPTVILTPGMAEAAERGDWDLDAMAAEFGPRLPLGRVGVPDDVARVALFCASDLASFMTGCEVRVDAGDMFGGQS
jgi:NAD(P)-dependent dehydrogenase (short-subunit alcohol dehydrogenase family)